MISHKNPDFTDKKNLEKYSSAFTLSDMEIFIFPELLYPLVLANIMSPLIWKWRDDPWFRDIETKSFNHKANRIKQYIIQNYVFNLDLSTWGLTTKTGEINRFSDFFDTEMLKQSNALFGYEGDKYYFDMDIRKHFGLDKFDSDIIPYWKTETVEAMTAFRHKEGFSTGAGECVSLSALYAASMFIVGRIPLEQIFLIATPLHSQNFITEKEGLITNNRRIVTKNMWFNGTSLSEKARRALENEKVTIVSHISGYIHLLDTVATVNPESYRIFSSKLRSFLTTKVNSHVFINFLRFKSKYKALFQFRCSCSGQNRYIPLEKMFEYEHTSRHSVSADSRAALVAEIDGDEFHLSPLQGKLIINDLEESLNKSHKSDPGQVKNMIAGMSEDIDLGLIEEMIADLQLFVHTEPALPDSNKNYISTNSLSLSVTDNRDTAVQKIIDDSAQSELSALALYVYRDMDRLDWTPYIKASVERNPVCFNELAGRPLGEVYEILLSLPDESVYDGNRLALPDEVWNFKRGDGTEKAVLLSDVILKNNKNAKILLTIDNERVILKYENQEFRFVSHKSFSKRIEIDRGKILIHQMSPA